MSKQWSGFMSRAGEWGRATDMNAPQRGHWGWESPNWIYDSIRIGTWQGAGISWLGGQAIKPPSDGVKITPFKLNSLQEILATFLQRIVEEKNCAKHGTSLFIFANFPSTLFNNRIKLVVPKHVINCIILDCNILLAEKWPNVTCTSGTRVVRWTEAYTKRNKTH